MTQSGSMQSCNTKCWGLAAALGFISMILALTVRHYGFGTSLFLGLLVLVLSGLVLTWLMCAEVPKLGESSRAKGISSGAGTAGGGSGSSVPVASDSVLKAVALDEPAATPSAALVAEKADATAVAKEAPKTTEASTSTPSENAGQGGSTAEAAGASATMVKPSAALAGEAELSSRKGNWKYDGAEKATPADAPGTIASAQAQTPLSADAEPQAIESSRPNALDAPRGGKADDLKQIKGIGPKLEKQCNSLGFYHFDQIASWNAEEVAWMDANLEGFRGRVTRDEWVSQAKLLADGGETEFSKRVDKGGVY